MRKLRAIDLNRDDCRVEVKIRERFTAIMKKLDSPIISAENVYNMKEIVVLLRVLGSPKALASKDGLRKQRAVAVLDQVCYPETYLMLCKLFARACEK